ncbi:DinB family protein [Xanthovirga aplysinae]|uniref:DinB family protein n=1 Tax=Xanthovirga aplysinae TaxID=2529853 RepID=UPI0012BD4481|nr:DinB family protein [Xanthovirga aplysinae]MTI31166.1 DinB family protein [Xanthovirga aplysinae]
MKTDTDTLIRKEILSFLTEQNAHLRYEEVLDNYPEHLINKKLENVDYTPWQLLEHIRLCQKDILDFVVNPNYTQSSWPEGYWSKKGTASIEDWNNSYQLFLEDLSVITKLITNKELNLFEPMPAGKKYSLFREVLLIIDHNSYHLGQLALFKKTGG